VRRLVLASIVLAVALPPAAARADAGPVAEIIDAGGAFLDRAAPGPYASQADYGYLLTVGSSARDAGGVALRDVSILGGRIRIARMFVPAAGIAGARIDGLQVNGKYTRATPNSVLRIGDRAYAVVLQEAALPGRLGRDIGLVGLRVVAGNRQVLVWLSRPPAPVRSPHALPSLLLGLAPLATFGGPALVDEPLFLRVGGGSGARAVAIAEQFLGVRYVWAGASPVDGFDCSGFTMYVYAQLGVQLTHFSGAQWNEGSRVPVDQLAPGDLVFFEPGASGPGHVGIYIGGGEFIHAPHTGDVVKISSLYESSYSFSYVGAVRPH
jgi:hypothetical protein